MLDRFVDAWARVCLTYRKTVLLLVAAVTVVTAAQLPKVHFDNALETWFLEGDPALVNHHKLLETFGSDELVVAGIEAPDVFAPEVIEKIGRATAAIEKAPNVEKVFSLTNIEAIAGKDDSLEIHDLVPLPVNPAELPAIRERALRNELYVGSVVSANGRFAAILIRLPHRTDQIDYKIAAVGAVRRILEHEFGSDFYLAGGPVFDEQFFYQSEKDSFRTTGLMLALLVVVLWVLTRSAWGVVLPIATVGMATVWTLGAMVLSGTRINVITTILPPLLLAVGVADAMHMLVDFQNRVRAGDDSRKALFGVYQEVFGPLFLTGMTTAIGMLSLMVSRIEAIRRFGMFSGFGVSVAFLLTVTFVPIVLSYLPRPAPRKARSKPYLSTRALEALHGFTMRHSRGVAVTAAAVLVVSVGLATRVRAESSFLKIFKPSAKIRVDTEKIQRAMAGTLTMTILVDTGREDGVKDPAVLQRLVEFERFLEAQPHVTAAESITGYFKDMRRAFFANDQREYKLPATREEAAQYLLLYELGAPDGDLHEMVTQDYRQTRVTARVRLESSNASAALVDATQDWLAKNFPPDLKTTVTGLLVMYADMENYIRDSLVQGFSSAMVCIFMVFCVQMRSVVLGSLVMLANSMSILVTLGIMGLTGIRLDPMTAMVASIAIGLADDDSIHFVSRVRSKLDQGIAATVALREALVEVGRALVYSSFALCAGFGVMLTSGFVGAIYFGLLTMLTILVSLVSDLVFLPVLLRWHDTRRRRMRAPAREPVASEALES